MTGFENTFFKVSVVIVRFFHFLYFNIQSYHWQHIFVIKKKVFVPDVTNGNM